MAKILICTGIYPPHVGGPSQYAKEVADEFRRQGNEVKVLTYVLERKLPTFIRHKLFFYRTLFSLWGVDFIFALDMFSVGFPAVIAAKLLGRKIIIRTGGDFLWESYVERTGDLVLFRDFYQKSLGQLNLKERVIFHVTKWTLHNASSVVFSTDWQRKIFEHAYGLNPQKNFIIENFYGPKLPAVHDVSKDLKNKSRIFVAGTRPIGTGSLKWKNIERLKKAFVLAKLEIEENVSAAPIELDLNPAPYEQFLNKIRNAYAVILVSLGDISPNMILDAIRSNTPFILTKETGLFDRLKDIGLFVDPENEADIREKILFLADPVNHAVVQEKIKNFTFTHSWGEICKEIAAVARKIGAKV